MIGRRSFIRQAGALGLLGGGLPMALGAATAATAGEAPYEWKSVPFGGGGFIDGFVFHPRERGLLYARTDIGGAYRFDPGTRSWIPLLDQLTRSQTDLSGVLSLALDPNDPDRVFVAGGLYLDPSARRGALLASTDRGATWQVNELPVRLGGNSPGRGSGERLQVDPDNGEILYLGTSQDGLMASVDRGRSFTPLGFEPRHVSLVLVAPGSGRKGKGSQVLWVGSHDKPGLHVSHDAGRTFERVAATPAQAPQHAVFGNDGTLYVAFAIGDGPVACNPSYAKRGSVWKRDPSGKWTDITPEDPAHDPHGFGYSGIDVDRQVPGRLVVSTIERWSKGDDVFVSTDDGAHWTSVGAHSRHDASRYPWLANYLRGEDKMGHWLADIKLDPFDGERAIYGTGYGLWLTHNLGAAHKGDSVQWDFAVANLEETATLEIRSPSGGATLLGAMGDVSGAAWDDIGKTPRNGLFAPSNQTNRAVDFAQLRPAVLARTADQAETGGWWSSDGSVIWRPFGKSTRTTASATGGYLNAGTIAVSAGGSAFVWAPEKQPALCSHDHGKTWVAVAGWPSGEVDAVPVADRHVEGVFYAHDRAAGEILVSVDGGLSFRTGVTGLPKLASWQPSQLVAAPGAVRDLWLALHDTLLHLPGPEKPAIAIRNVVECWKLALGKAAPGKDYHCVYLWGKLQVGDSQVEGLFRSDDAGAHFTRIDDDRHRYGLLLSLAADPLEYGTVYLAPHGRGVIVGKPRQGA
ncbi:MAG: WD40/YVTN/BNR-like repeat-containing protein [Burkholderiaceae bacterium]